MCLTHGHRSYGCTLGPFYIMVGSTSVSSIGLFCFWALSLPLMTLSCKNTYRYIGMPNPFMIIPEGDAFVEYNHDPLNLTCILDITCLEKGINSSLMNFQYLYNNSIISVDEIRSYTRILNSTAIQLLVPKNKLNPGQHTFSCSIDAKGLLHRVIVVYVGYKPQEVLNYSCEAPNWQIFTCSWTPAENPVKVNYTVNVFVPPLAQNIKRACNISGNSCSISGGDYHQARPELILQINSSNALGHFSENHTIQNYQVVVPAPPTNLELRSTATRSAVIAWNVPHPLQNFPPGLIYNIEIKNPWESWKTVNSSSIPPGTTNVTYNITNLLPGATYDVRVTLKAPNGTRPSEPAPLIFKTLPEIPLPPQTVPGAFQMDGSYKIIVYWKKLLDQERNGPGLHYVVHCLKNGAAKCTNSFKNVTITESYAMFPSPEDNANYNFSIYSVNAVGPSKTFSQVNVPKHNTVPRPEKITRVKYGAGVHGVNWYRPAGNKKISNYTVFYCEDNSEAPQPCQNSMMNWVIVGNETSKNITVSNASKGYHFGVSAQTANGDSSGIAWATCVVSELETTKPNLDLNHITSTTVEVEWGLECYEHLTAEIILRYCPVKFSEQKNDNCTGNVTEKIIKASSAFNTTLKDLKPYTTYEVKIEAVNKHGKQLGKADARVTTLEGAPSPPRRLTATNVTNSSVLLVWQKPEHENGKLQRYILYEGLFERGIIEYQNHNDSALRSEYTYTNLRSSTNYTFSLKACTGLDYSTQRCSNKSEEIHVSTKMGTPAMMRGPHVSILNQTTANVSWEAPDLLSAIFSYDIKIESRSQSKIYSYTGYNAIVPIEEFCDVHKNELKFFARAINNDKENNETLECQWSDPPISARCDAASGSYYIEIILIGLLGIVLAVMVPCLVKRGKCKEIRDVVVRLPSGLEPNPEMEKTPREQWPPQHRNIENQSNNISCGPSDKDTLLTKKTADDEDGKCGNYESSSSESEGICARDNHVMPWEEPVRSNGCGGGIVPHDQEGVDVKEMFEDNESVHSSRGHDIVNYNRVNRTEAPAASGYVTISDNGHVINHPALSPVTSAARTSPSIVTKPSVNNVYVKLPPISLASSTSTSTKPAVLGASKPPTTYLMNNFGHTSNGTTSPNFTESSFSIEPVPALEQNDNKSDINGDTFDEEEVNAILDVLNGENNYDEDGVISVRSTSPPRQDALPLQISRSSYVPHQMFKNNFVQ